MYRYVQIESPDWLGVSDVYLSVRPQIDSSSVNRSVFEAVSIPSETAKTLTSKHDEMRDP